MYQTLLDEHRVLQTNYDDVVSEKDDIQARLREARHDAESRRNDKADGMMRAEIDRLRAELYVIFFDDVDLLLIVCKGRRAKTTWLLQKQSWTG